MSNDDVIDFEDLFEIVTPTGVEARILNLDAAWQALYLSDKNNSYVNNEYKSWQKWRDLALDSTLSKWFASGTLSELEEWKQRYAVAYKKIKNNSAPDPNAFKYDKMSIWNSPGFWIGAGAILAISAILLVNFSSGKPLKALASSTKKVKNPFKYGY